MARYRATRAGEITPVGSVRRRVEAGEEIEFDGVLPGSWLLPIDSEAKARTVKALPRMHGLAHRHTAAIERAVRSS